MLALASSYRGGEVCTFYREPARGSYNNCYFVQFGTQPGSADKWVVCVPLEPVLAQVGRAKLKGGELPRLQYGSLPRVRNPGAEVF